MPQTHRCTLCILVTLTTCSAMLFQPAIAEPKTADTTASTTDAAQANGYRIDTVHSTILFSLRYMGTAQFYGVFTGFDGAFHVNTNDLSKSFLQVNVNPASIDTRNTKRDKHIANTDYFDTNAFPQSTFKSVSFTKISDNTYSVEGDFTLHGVTKQVTASLTDFGANTIRGRTKAGIEATLQFKRSDFGIAHQLAPGDGENGPLGDIITLTVALIGDPQ